jgi:hypothetical protein
LSTPPVKDNGADPDFHRRDLWDAIQRGDYPSWELGLELFDDEFADRFAFDIRHPTKIIPEELVPVGRVGRLVLDRLVDNFFAETEQAAFCTQNNVPASTSATTCCCRATTSPTWTPGWPRCEEYQRGRTVARALGEPGKLSQAQSLGRRHRIWRRSAHLALAAGDAGSEIGDRAGGEPNVEHDARLDDARAALLVDGLEPVTVIEPVQHDRCVRALPG